MWGPSSWLTEQAYQRHLLQTMLVDRLLGLFVRRLKRFDLYKPSLVSVIADHGVGFAPGYPKRGIAHETVGDLAPVPFFLKMPGGDPRRISDAPVETLDLVPTIADALDLSKVPPAVEGRSALQPIPPDRTRSMASVEIDPLGREKYEVVEEKYSIFGSNGGSLDLFSLGPAGTANLLGTKVAELEVRLPTGASAEIPDMEYVAGASRENQVIPALLEGTLAGVKPGALIAASMNGEIVAACRAYKSDDQVRFAVFFPPDSFAEPPHDVGLFVIDDVKRGTLMPLTVAS
jgi:hypothetical protein